MNPTIELNEFMQQFKEEIERLINNGSFTDAGILIKEYRRNMPESIELFSMEAVIALMEGNFNAAEQVLRMGLMVDQKNSDLLFNMGYLQELKKKDSEAIAFYTRAKEFANESVRDQINGIVENLQSNEGSASGQALHDRESAVPVVSVVIPTYNMKEYLKETIDSILLQDFEDLEIVVGDDCSSDGTDLMMEQYKDNPKVRYIRNKTNLGPSENSKALLYHHARGKYALGINHDDYLIKNDYISQAVAILEANPNVSFVFSNVKYLNMASNKIGQNAKMPLEPIMSGIDYFLNYQTGNYLPIPSTLTSIYRIEDARSMGCLHEDVYSQDTFLYLKLMLLGDVAYIEDYAGVYRVHNKSLSHNMPLDKDHSTLEEFERLYAFALMKGLPKDKCDLWLNIRILNYVRWRLMSTWSSNKKYALELIMSLNEHYPVVFNTILSEMQWENRK